MSMILQDTEVQQNDEHMTLMNFSFERHGLEFNYLRAFEFDDDFNQPDAGQIQNQPTALDEKDLLIRLRDITKRDSLLIPYAFYVKARAAGSFRFEWSPTGRQPSLKRVPSQRSRSESSARGSNKNSHAWLIRPAARGSHVLYSSGPGSWFTAERPATVFEDYTRTSTTVNDGKTRMCSQTQACNSLQE
jgi:hypothetical protein